MPIAINGSGTITGVSVGGLPDGIVDTDMIAANAVTAPKRGAGAILQVVQSTKTDRVHYNTGSFTDTGLEVSITPSSASNKVLVTISFSATTNVNTQGFFVLDRGGSMLGIGDAEGSRTRCSVVVHHIDNDNDLQSNSIVYLDSPNTTSAITYKLRTKHDGSGAVYLNGTKNSTNAVGDGRTASTITAMEIAG